MDTKNNNIKTILEILRTMFDLKKVLVGDISGKSKQYDLNRSEVFTLLNISDEKVINMSRLHDDVGLKRGSLTTVIDNLIKKGYVKRENDSDDRRKILIRLTGEGKKVTQSICVHIEEIALNKIENLTEKDKDDFMDAFNTIRYITKKFKEGN